MRPLLGDVADACKLHTYQSIRLPVMAFSIVHWLVSQMENPCCVLLIFWNYWSNENELYSFRRIPYSYTSVCGPFLFRVAYCYCIFDPCSFFFAVCWYTVKAWQQGVSTVIAHTSFWWMSHFNQYIYIAQAISLIKLACKTLIDGRKIELRYQVSKVEWFMICILKDLCTYYIQPWFPTN